MNILLSVTNRTKVQLDLSSSVVKCSDYRVVLEGVPWPGVPECRVSGPAAVICRMTAVGVKATLVMEAGATVFDGNPMLDIGIPELGGRSCGYGRKNLGARERQGCN